MGTVCSSQEFYIQEIEGPQDTHRRRNDEEIHTQLNRPPGVHRSFPSFSFFDDMYIDIKKTVHSPPNFEQLKGHIDKVNNYSKG